MVNFGLGVTIVDDSNDVEPPLQVDVMLLDASIGRTHRIHDFSVVHSLLWSAIDRGGAGFDLHEDYLVGRSVYGNDVQLQMVQPPALVLDGVTQGPQIVGCHLLSVFA